jgi:site-specific recombinase XerD
MKHLSKDQVRKVVDAAKNDRVRLFLTVIYEHGLRVSEGLALTPSSLQRGYLVLKPKKDGEPAVERMRSETAELWGKITATLLPGTRIFPFCRQWASDLFQEAAARAGVELAPKQGIHTLRHSIAHHLLDSGASLPVVQKSLRHRSLGSTGVYLQPDASDVDRWKAVVLQ